MTEPVKLSEEIKALLDDTAEQEGGVWNSPIVCRVEVDLPGWLNQLTGSGDWEVLNEEEDESCISFAMREKNKADRKAVAEDLVKTAEVTLYHNGYAVVNVDGEDLFDGNLTTGTSQCAHLSYYNAESGEPILLN